MGTHRCTIIAILLATWIAAATGACAQEPADPYMGDWQGMLTLADGTQQPLCAQVICWGREGYQANLLPAFDVRVQPLAVLHGKTEGEALVFEGDARIAEGAFTGKLTGDPAGTYEMEHVVRLSPTLGEKPPAGAVVLFDGTNLDEWLSGGSEAFMIDLSREVGGDDRVAYLRSRITSPRAQPALLELGSDDGVKAWLNGALVHANNANRPCRAWDDQVAIELEEGENVLVLKVVQGGGGWAACARIRGQEGEDLEGLSFDPAPALDPGEDPKSVQGDSAGTIVTWELAGPFTQEGKRDGELFDVVFPPEEDDPAVEWRVINDHPRPQYRWKVVEGGAMEVTPGSGVLIAKRIFTDYQLHLEFRLPFMPDQRGQGRANSGVYLQGRYEIQLLDSYGLEGRDNECGGMYSVKAPDVNMCAPPLQWQTYDIEFHDGRTNAATGEAQNARMTVYHNGVVIHDDVEIPVPSTPGGGGDGGLLLQDHGNPLQFRNIWVLELPQP